MTTQVSNEKELLEIVELAKVTEQKAREMSDKATAIAEKCQCWYEAGQVATQKQR
jgi:hypothetical protein